MGPPQSALIAEDPAPVRPQCWSAFPDPDTGEGNPWSTARGPPPIGLTLRRHAVSAGGHQKIPLRDDRPAAVLVPVRQERSPMRKFVTVLAAVAGSLLVLPAAYAAGSPATTSKSTAATPPA